MMVRSLLLLPFAAWLAAGAQAPAGVTTGRVDAVVESEMTRQRIPGAAVAVVRDGGVFVVRGYGLANLEHRVAVTPETIFQSGSLGKMFTSAAVMLQVEDGKLSLTDPIARFFPGAPAAWGGITVRHLLTHTSGIPEYTAGAIDLRRDYTEDDFAAMAYGLQPSFAPGEKWTYSNTGYVLLGIIVRKASGMFYGDVLAERVFKPLGMKTARVISESDIVPHRAAGYTLVKGEWKNQDWVSPSLNTTGDGALYLSLNDMVAWDAGVRGRRILSAASWDTVLSPGRLNDGSPHGYGFGWRIDSRGGQPRYHHGGSWQGFKTHYSRFARGDLSVIVLANLRQANPERIADAVAEAIDPGLKSGTRGGP